MPFPQKKNKKPSYYAVLVWLKNACFHLSKGQPLTTHAMQCGLTVRTDFYSELKSLERDGRGGCGLLMACFFFDEDTETEWFLFLCLHWCGLENK